MTPGWSSQFEYAARRAQKASPEISKKFWPVSVYLSRYQMRAAIKPLEYQKTEKGETMMNRIIKKRMTLVAVVLTLCLFPLEHSTLAQEQSTSAQSAQSAHSNCRNVKGKLSEVSSANGTTGRITKGGILNGRTQLIFTSGVLPTPDPTAVSYTTDFTVTTNRGVLRSHNVGIFEFAIGFFTEIARIDPNASSGRFAGATGVLFTSGKTPDGGATFQSNITGQICLAHHGGEDDDENDDDDR